MKKHAIIPIFIPHLGCPNDCVFCNQRSITARTEAPTAEAVRTTIEEWLTTLNHEETEIEIAFYGGSFTGLSIDEQNYYLDIAKEYLDSHKIDGIHLSTRPDYIDQQILDNLKSHGVTTIELGVQSFDDEVLKKSKRGHTAADVYKATDLIKEQGFKLGIQLMIGLPGDSLETCIYSAEEAVKIKPQLARLYPTIVLDDTELKTMYECGGYQALSRDEAITRTKEMYKLLDEAGIYIMRVGLKSTDIIGDGGAINGGTYHPAFRQLVESAIIRDKLEPKLARINGPAKVNVFSNSSGFSNLIGNNKENKLFFAEKFPELNIRYGVDNSLEDGELKVLTQNSMPGVTPVACNFEPEK